MSYVTDHGRHEKCQLLVRPDLIIDEACYALKHPDGSSEAAMSLSVRVGEGLPEVEI